LQPSKRGACNNLLPDPINIGKPCKFSFEPTDAAATHNISKICKFSFKLRGAAATHNINACDNFRDPNFDWPINLIERMTKVIGKPCNMPTPPKFSFKLTGAAAMHIINILRKYKFDVGRALEANKDSPLGPGKEFKPPDKLRKAFGLHLLRPEMEMILKNRSKWLLTEISKKERQQTFSTHSLLAITREHGPNQNCFESSLARM
jgi:hypothetical protein